MIRASTYEVNIEVGGKPEIEGIYADEKAALERAEYLLKQAKYTAVRVYKVGSRDDHKLVFEKFYTGRGGGGGVSALDEAFLCLSAGDVYAFGSRQTLLRLLRGYFDQQLMVPLELLHNYMSLRYIERDALIFNQAAHRLAALQAKAAKVAVHDRYDALIRLYREVTVLSKDAPQTLASLYRCLADRGLGALIGEVTATLPASEHNRAITYALAHHLGEARDWNLKLTAACELFSEDQDSQTGTCLDELLSEVIDGAEPVRAAIGYAPDLITALEALLAAIDGSWDDRLPGTPALQKLSDIMAHQPLPLVRRALLGRIAGALDGTTALTKGDRANEAAALKRLIPKLIEFGGFMGGVPMSAALTRRAKIALGGGEDLSFESAVGILTSSLPNPAARIGYLLDLLSSDVGRRKAAMLTQSIAELFNGVRNINDFAPDRGDSLSHDMVREDFRRRLYQAGIPRRLSDGLVRRLTQLAAGPAVPRSVRLPGGGRAAALAPPRPMPELSGPETQRPPLSADMAERIGRLQLTYLGVQYMVDPSQTPFAIGRSEGCELTVDCGTASRRHALIQVAGTDFMLVDQSKNGTFVCGEGHRTIALTRSSTILTGKGLITIGTSNDDPAVTEQAMIRFQRLETPPR